MIKYILVVFNSLAIIAFTACDNPTEQNEYSLPFIQYPTLSSSNISYSDATLSFRYSLPKSSTVTIWIEKAHGIQEYTVNSYTFTNAKIFTPSKNVLVVLVASVQQAGAYSINYDFHINNTQKLQPGFYRIYAQLGSNLFTNHFILLNK